MRRLVGAITNHPLIAILLVVIVTAGLGAGAPMVERTSSLDQFQSETTAADKLDYIQTNFAVGPENATTAQIIVRGENVLDRASLISMLEYERRLLDNQSVETTLTGDSPIVGIANVVAIAAIRQEQAAALQSTATELRQLNASIQQERSALKARARALNATAEALRAALTRLRQDRNASIAAAFEGVRANSSVTLNRTDAAIFREAAHRLRNATTEAQATRAYRLGTRGVLANDYASLQHRQAALEEDVERLRTLAQEVKRQRKALRSAPPPTLEEQVTQLREMNASAIEDVIRTVLSAEHAEDGGRSPLAFMPAEYDPGSTSASATMLVVTQESRTDSVGSGAAAPEIVDAQLAMRSIAEQHPDELDYLVFGSGVINHEIDTSMTDSLLLVGPLAIVFVLVALTIAYRDPLDILLGLLGIGLVLVWTFGFMGWTGIAFNQIFVAVPVLLIGLSIDYAIHIFMRHREERAVGDGMRSREAMAIALGGVGIALVMVTATTVIGFLSNLTSPVPPIQEFGIVSSAGIVAALVIFGVLIPSLKVILDGLFERVGIDRRKRAFGTGSSPVGRVLRIGSESARRFPVAILAIAVLVSVAGAYGGAQVDTSFDQADFLAEDPPQWMQELPEPFAPGEYHAKDNLAYVNDNFIREDTRAQLLLEGGATDPDTLHRLNAAQSQIDEKGFVARLPTGEADVSSPLAVMRSVAASNETFNATFTAADTDGDGVPERNVRAVYDALFAVAPDRAGAVIYRADGGAYRALRLVVSVRGDASSGEVTASMQSLADDLDGGGVEATATGQVVLFEIVQQQLLETVIQSLLVTLVAVFIFLLLIYRVNDGSATLGGLTVIPVVLSVSWILGTMYLLDIPFNVLTGMITSLTIGLGVAYSIHLSERYSQELDRSSSVWQALERSVTGTGGALLGSAATTVGGFGVLVFAVLPPLQQFGLITGLSIIYAFAASVLVLPSILVIWTRYLGPDWTERDFQPAVRAAGAGGVGRATRHTSTDVAIPGESVSVSVAVDGVRGRAVLSEHVPDTSLSVHSVDPEPSSVSVRGDRLYVVWSDLATDATVRYTVDVTDVAPGAEIRPEGSLAAPAADTPVEGQTEIVVVGDLVERATRTGTVTVTDVEAAAELLEDGVIDHESFERLYRAWIRETDPAAIPLESDD